jgi:lysophospholipase L1-like esterase
MPVDCFYDHWHQATGHPSYRQWRELLALEAKAAGRGKGSNALTVMVGDSLSQWFPADQLPARQIWLNQGISGDTTAGMLQRLSVLKTAQPDTIYLMAGVNDLKRGASDREILGNLHQILTRLRQQHPNVRIVVQSILPTRSRYIPNARIAQINPMIQALAQRHAADYLDLHQQFQDNNGELRRDLTTDGIHLSPQGYQVWQAALQRMDQHLAQRPRPIAQASVHRRNL